MRPQFAVVGGRKLIGTRPKRMGKRTEMKKDNQVVEAPLRSVKRKKAKLPRGIRRRGNSLVVYLTFPDGHAERRSLGNVSVGMAQEQRRVWQREIKEASYIKKVPRPEPVEPISFSQIGDKEVERSKNYKSEWATDDSRVKLLKEWWGRRPADSLSSEEIEAKLLKNMAPPPEGLSWSESTADDYRDLLGRIYRFAIKRHELTVNPAASVHRHNKDEDRARTRELTYAEEDRFRKAMRDLCPEKAPEFDLALNTGVRRGNLYGIFAKGRRAKPPLCWKDVDFDWKLVRLAWSKTGRGYTVPLNDAAMAALKQLRERCDGDAIGPVIRKTSGRTVHTCRRWFEACLEKAAIEDFRFHDLRHTFATRLRRNGVPLEDIAVLLNHDIPELRMTKRYAHADMDRLHKAVGTLVQTDTKTDTAPLVEFPKSVAV